MASIDQRLLDALERKLGISRRQVYQRIQNKASETFLDRDLAAIALAADSGINISRYATREQLATIRQANSGTAPVPLTVNVPSAAPRARPARATKSPRTSTKERRGNTVFVVHGRNEALRQALFSFLRSVGLHPIEWSEAIELTRKGSPHVSEILDAAFRKAVAIVVLLTPDDDAKLNKRFWGKHEPDYEKKLTGQARPNVLFEAGMAFGKNADATVLVQVGEVRQFSDVAGRHVVRMSNDTKKRQELITKLANAGCNVDTSGTDWHTEGKFSL
jgi:predicted nucleotide-binding protein